MKRCRDPQQGSRASHRHDCKAMHEVLAIKKVRGFQLASGLRALERVFLSFSPPHLSFPLSLCLLHPNQWNIPELSSPSEEIDFYLRRSLEVTWIRLKWMSATLWKMQDLRCCDVTLPLSCISCFFSKCLNSRFLSDILLHWHSTSHFQRLRFRRFQNESLNSHWNMLLGERREINQFWPLLNLNY